MLTRAALVRRPAVLAVSAAAALAGLLAGGSLVARAVEGGEAPAPTAVVAGSGATETPAAGGDNDAGPTTSQGDDNVAAAVNTKDGSTVYAVRLKVVRTSADVVDAGNAAVAVASCEDCTTVAIALEGVLVTGDAETVVPVNLALAYNQDCTSCQTLAYAYQKVMSTDGRVRLTGQGRRQIAALRAELNGLRRADLPLEEVRAVVRRVAQEFAAVLETQTRPVGGAGRATHVGADEATPEATPAGSGSVEPGSTDDAGSGDTAQPQPEETVSPTADTP